MPTTIAEGFTKLKQNLEITTLQSATVSKRQQDVRAVVDKKLTVLDSFLTGSYMRSTMIAPLSQADVDIFMVLHPDYYKADGHAALLDKVKAALKETYSTSAISRNGQAVTITFTDFKVDVVPAFKRKGGGYLIPDSILKRWIATDPKTHISVWSAANKKHNDCLVPLIKMIKAWNRAHSQLLHSFHLEAMILDILQNVKIGDYPSGALYVFDKARTRVKTPVADPAGHGSNIGDYLNTREKMDAVVSRLETAYQRALAAELRAKMGKVKDAYDTWGLIFGDYYPAYG